MSTFFDLIQNVELITNKSAISFDFDRFNNPNSALSLFNTVLINTSKVVYFEGDFSIMFWFKLKSASSVFNIFVFCQINSNCIQIRYNRDSSTLSAEFTFKNTSFIIKINYNFLSSSWYHIGYVLEGLTGYIYINASLIGQGAQTRTPTGYGTIQIGSNFVDSTFDSFKIFQGSLKRLQILKEFTSSLPGKFFFYDKSKICYKIYFLSCFESLLVNHKRPSIEKLFEI